MLATPLAMIVVAFLVLIPQRQSVLGFGAGLASRPHWLLAVPPHGMMMVALDAVFVALVHGAPEGGP